MEVGRTEVEVGTGMEMGTPEEQVPVVEPSACEKRGALLYFCTSVCLLLCESGWVLTGDLMNEAALQVADGQ